MKAEGFVGRCNALERRVGGADGNLRASANGEIRYAIRGVHAKVSVLWKFEAPAGAGDTHYSVMRGTSAPFGSDMAVPFVGGRRGFVAEDAPEP